MKSLTPETWIEIVKLIATFIIGIITALTVQSCTATMSVLWKNSNSTMDTKQNASTEVDSLTIKPNFNGSKHL